MDFNKILQMMQWQKNPNGVGENMGPLYREPGLASVGGSVNLPFNTQVGGTIGVANSQPFGNANVNGRQIGYFGPKEISDNGMTSDNPQPQSNPQVLQILQKILGGR